MRNSLILLVLTLGACASAPVPPPPARDHVPAPPTPSVTPPVAPETPSARALVQLVTLGDFPDELADAVEEGLRAELQVDVERIDRLPLPEDAYYPPRRRYRADRLLDHLDARLAGAPPMTRVIGMTDVDISTTKGAIYDWGVLGLGGIGGRSCVISLFRMRRRHPSEALVRFRAVTTAIHEVGHTLGLEHCTEDRCLMRDAEGRIATVDESTGHLGPECRAELEQRAPRSIE